MNPLIIRSLLTLGALALLSISLPAKDVVINDGFELDMSGLEEYWSVEDFESTYPYPCWGVNPFDTTGDGMSSLAFWSFPFKDDPKYGDCEGYLVQQIFVQAGRSYLISGDICRTNC